MGFPDAAPLIAVTGRKRGAGGAHDGPAVLDALSVDVYFSGYAEHIAAAGGLPLHVPAGVDPEALADRVDAVVLTGGGDIDPARYGAPLGGAQGVDPARDAREIALWEAASARGLPVLAICRGLQVVNVARGGTLHTHLAEHIRSPRHEVTFEPGSALHRLHGPSAEVNSLHHQSVDRPGVDLVVTARASDGVVEGIETRDGRMLGVQWHPEQMSAAPRPVFRWLVAATRARVSHGVTS